MFKKVFLCIVVALLIGSIIASVMLLNNGVTVLKKLKRDRILYSDWMYKSIFNESVRSIILVSILQLSAIASTIYCIVLYFRTPLKVATEDYRAWREARREERQEKKRQRLQEKLERMSKEHE